MAVRIRLRRIGKKKQPQYRLIVAEASSPRDGRFIESIGRYNPRLDPPLISVDEERALSWLRQGAQPSDTAKSMLVKTGVWEKFTGEPTPTPAPSPAPQAVAEERAEVADPKPIPEAEEQTEAADPKPIPEAAEQTEAADQESIPEAAEQTEVADQEPSPEAEEDLSTASPKGENTAGSDEETAA